MSSELDVLRIVSERLEAAGLAFMLTGSLAMSYYATPRMTRDLDLVDVAMDRDYLTRWAVPLGVSDLLRDVMP